MRDKIDWNVRNVLVCLRYGIGDLVMELPVLKTLRQNLPDAHITALGAEPAVNLLDNSGIADRTMTYQQWNIRDWYDYGSPDIAERVRDWLLDQRFELVLDAYHAPPVVRNQVYLCCENTFDFHPAAEERTLIRGADGITAIKAGILSGWGMPICPESVPRIDPTPQEMQFADLLLTGGFLSRQTLIGLSMSASSPLKAWPSENYAALINKLAAEQNCSFLLFAGPDNDQLCQTFYYQLACQDQVMLVCNLHLREVAALLSRCDLFVGNDSGLMHIAAAVGTTPVALFGPTDCNVYLPRWVQGRAAGIENTCGYRKKSSFGHPDCVVAGRCLADDHCLSHIRVDAVAEMIQETFRTALRQTSG